MSVQRVVILFRKTHCVDVGSKAIEQPLPELTGYQTDYGTVRPVDPTEDILSVSNCQKILAGAQLAGGFSFWFAGVEDPVLTRKYKKRMTMEPPRDGFVVADGSKGRTAHVESFRKCPSRKDWSKSLRLHRILQDG